MQAALSDTPGSRPGGPTNSHKFLGLMPVSPVDCPSPIIPWSEARDLHPSWNSWGYVIEAKGWESLGVGVLGTSPVL